MIAPSGTSRRVNHVIKQRKHDRGERNVPGA
jgi:hypothetical protein